MVRRGMDEELERLRLVGLEEREVRREGVGGELRRCSNFGPNMWFERRWESSRALVLEKRDREKIKIGAWEKSTFLEKEEARAK